MYGVDCGGDQQELTETAPLKLGRTSADAGAGLSRENRESGSGPKTTCDLSGPTGAISRASPGEPHGGALPTADLAPQTLRDLRSRTRVGERRRGSPRAASLSQTFGQGPPRARPLSPLNRDNPEGTFFHSDSGTSLSPQRPAPRFMKQPLDWGFPGSKAISSTVLIPLTLTQQLLGWRWVNTDLRSSGAGAGGQSILSSSGFSLPLAAAVAKEGLGCGFPFSLSSEWTPAAQTSLALLHLDSTYHQHEGQLVSCSQTPREWLGEQSSSLQGVEKGPVKHCTSWSHAVAFEYYEYNVANVNRVTFCVPLSR